MLSKNQISIFLSVLLFLISGCSLLTSKDQFADSDDQFKKVVGRRTNKETIPVEVATEFNQLVVDEDVSLPTLNDDSKLKNPFKNLRTKRQPAGPSVAMRAEAPAEIPVEVSRNESEPIKKLMMKNSSRQMRTLSSQKSAKGKYIVKPGDTLMKISFEKYGDIYQWRNILNDNRDKIINKSVLFPGTELTINDVDYVVIEKNGSPYLIKKNDTLVKISKSVYGTGLEWKHIWQNNPQLIKDPNKIYAGFTLYYQDLVNKPLADKKVKSSSATADSIGGTGSN
jgi:nucleoid-associated protein YgaU